MKKRLKSKKFRSLWLLMCALSAILLIAPTAFYTVKAVISDALIINKVMLASGVFACIIAAIVCLFNKALFRSKIWILLIGLYLCLDGFISCLIITGCCQIAEELIVSPLRHRFREIAMINKEIERNG